MSYDDANSMRLIGIAHEYLQSGGLFNPELMDHEKVRDLIVSMKDELHGWVSNYNARLIEAQDDAYRLGYARGICAANEPDSAR